MWNQTPRRLWLREIGRKGLGHLKRTLYTLCLNVELFFAVTYSEQFWLSSHKILFGIYIQCVPAFHIVFLPRLYDFHSLEISKQMLIKPRKKKNMSKIFLRSINAYFPGYVYATS